MLNELNYTNLSQNNIVFNSNLEQWNFTPLMASKNYKLRNGDVLKKTNSKANNSIRILLVADDVKTEQEAQKFCLNYLSVYDTQGLLINPSNCNVTVFSTDQYELARTLFNNLSANEQLGYVGFDGIIINIVNDSNQQRKSWDIIKSITSCALNPFPTILMISNNHLLVKDIRLNRINPLQYAIYQHPYPENKEQLDNDECQDFFKQFPTAELLAEADVDLIYELRIFLNKPGA